MHFCHVTTFYPPYSFGGDAIGLQRLCHALARRGHRVTVICDLDAFYSLHHGAEPALSDEPTGIEVIRLRSKAGKFSSLLTQQLGTPIVHRGELRARLESADIDVINFHNVSLVGGAGVLAMGHAPKLYMAHEHWLVCASHVLWRHNREPCNGRECLRCVLTFRRPPQLWRYTDALHRAAQGIDTFIAMSEFSRRKHLEFGFPFPMQVVPYLIPDADIQQSTTAAPVVTARPHARPYFLFVGRLEKIKGVDTILPAFTRYPDADLLIVGDGQERQPLEAQAAGDPRIKFLGRLPQEKLAQYYAHAIALIVPSVGFETFGLILLESFLQATPVIARRLGPFPEIVAAAEGGELFETTDELLAAMQRLQHDGERRARQGASGRAAVRRLWSESAVVPRYLDLATAAIERQRSTVNSVSNKRGRQS